MGHRYIETASLLTLLDTPSEKTRIHSIGYELKRPPGPRFSKRANAFLNRKRVHIIWRWIFLTIAFTGAVGGCEKVSMKLCVWPIFHGSVKNIIFSPGGIIWKQNLSIKTCIEWCFISYTIVGASMIDAHQRFHPSSCDCWVVWKQRQRLLVWSRTTTWRPLTLACHILDITDHLWNYQH
jgi:hypothetical protein